ncbi:MAG TPA: hypothetical protein VFC46_01640 [Humisphaera sp.]|nr:hypothetical protein [Humisphaera sp.]
MTIQRILTVLMTLTLALSAYGAEAPSDALLFDFETPAELANWAPVKLADVKSEQPAPRIELSADGATSGKSCLKITFAGGQWSAIGTTVIPVKGTWKEFQTLKADITVDHDVVAYVGIGQGPQDPAALKPQWQKTLMLIPGRNEVALTIRHGLGRTVIDPKQGEITSFIIGMFQPAVGDVLRVDNIRLSAEWPAPQVTGWFSPYNHDGYSSWAAADFHRTKVIPRFDVLGADMKVASYEELSKKLKPSWKPAAPLTVDQVEAEFKAVFEELKKTNPDAVMTVLRETRNDPDTGKNQTGWKFTYLNCHGPDGPNAGREGVAKKYETVEAFMRHRGVLLQPDFSPIPKGAKILAARFVLTRVVDKDSKPIDKPNLYVAEPCNRDWDPDFANCYYYAKGKHWKAVNGIYYGEDPDFYPSLLFHGPGSSPVNSWDFTAGLKFWIEQGHENHGFFIYGDAGDYMRIYTPKAKDIRQRPAIWVVYSAAPAK